MIFIVRDLLLPALCQLRRRHVHKGMVLVHPSTRVRWGEVPVF